MTLAAVLIAFAAFAALVLLAMLFELAQILRAGPRGTPAVTRLGPAFAPGATPAPLPRIVWTYWDTLPPPTIVDQCLRNWRRFAPDHEIRLLDKTSIAQWLQPIGDAARFAALPPYRQADWLRLQLLKLHGGLWIDASTLLADNLDWVHRLHAQAGGLVGFHIDRYTTEPARPVIENWFIAAGAGDPFIVAWAEEFEHALELGEDAYIEHLRASGSLKAAAQGIPLEMRAYLIMHLAAGVVSARAPLAHAMTLLRAEDVAFAFHAPLRWRKRHLYARLALTPAPRRVPALIKLRGGDRAVVEKGLARGLWLRGSLLARLLELD